MRALRTTAAALVALAALSACGRNDMESADTTTVPAIDSAPGTALPATDTVVRSSTTDSLQRDTTKTPATKTP
jgi:hypothetical protein